MDMTKIMTTSSRNCYANALHFQKPGEKMTKEVCSESIDGNGQTNWAGRDYVLSI